MVEIKEEIKTCYLIELSNKRSIQIDPEELPKVLNGIKSGSPVILKRGIFNPSFFVDIVEDDKRIMEVVEHNRTIDFQIKNGMAKPSKLEPLKDIFEKVRGKYLEAPNK